MRRRYFLKAAAAGSAAIAGCFTDDESEDLPTDDNTDVNDTDMEDVNKSLEEDENEELEQNGSEEPSNNETEPGNPSDEYELLAETEVEGKPHPNARYKYIGEDGEQIIYELEGGRTESQNKSEDEEITLLDCMSEIHLELSGGGENDEEILSDPEWYAELESGDIKFEVERTDCSEGQLTTSMYTVGVYELVS